MPAIAFDAVTVTYGQASPLRQASFRILGSTVAIMGPSGSGKSTLLRLIGGLQRPASGVITIDAQPVAVADWKASGDKRVALVHQDYRLAPFLTVAENLYLAADVRKVRLSSASVADALEMVGLTHVGLDRMPGTLSGGEQQRVAIARALVCQPAVLLADEPTGALDEENTIAVAELLFQIGQRSGRSVVVATHDSVVAGLAGTQYRIVDGGLQQSVF